MSYACPPSVHPSPDLAAIIRRVASSIKAWNRKFFSALSVSLAMLPIPDSTSALTVSISASILASSPS